MLKIKILLVVGMVMMQLCGWSQEDLQVQGATPNLYIAHTVVAKETWYSVGRLFNQVPKDIAAFNNTGMDKPLVIGQSLKIPLTNANFSQDGKKAADEVFVPVQHIVQEKEWMYRVGQNYNKISVETLEKWNNIKNDQLRVGMKLTVGYLKVKPGQSALASKGTDKIVPATPQVPAMAANAPAEQSQQQPPVKKEEEKKEVVVTTPPPANNPVKETTTTVPVKEEPKTTAPAPVTETSTAGNTPVNYKGGYFKSMYSNAGKGTTGNAGIFRSTSGWKDGKYYALMNDVAVGTIVKVTFPSTNKSVYAKVLGQLPDMKESTGLTIRINDAAASELGAENGKFYVDVKY
ncbi:MAG: LysM peptidoglycan-binding domain-containing protein [Chitinophagaceae bacterium]